MALQEPMSEKRAQVEHLLEVLGLQVIASPSVALPSDARRAIA